MIKLFVTDLDGTLLYKKVREVEPNDDCKQAIARLQADGIDFAIATGRYDSDIQAVEKYLPLTKKGYRIGMNGGTLNNAENEKLRELVFAEEDARHIFNFFEKKLRHQTAFVITCTNSEERFFHRIGHIVNPLLWLFWRTRAEAVSLTKVEQFITSDRTFYKILASASKDNTDFIDLKLQNNFTEFEVFKTSPYSVEICPKGANKGEALAYVMQKEGLKPDEVAFVGDSGNDVAAFKAVKHSFVMEHADHYVQEHARYVVRDVAEAIDMVIRYNADLCCKLTPTGKVEAMRQAQIDNRRDHELVEQNELNLELTQPLPFTKATNPQKVRQRQRVPRQNKR
ncbi:MAG: Cof-type HAD-IIB family hydrolase [Culicoidibacterales bacterium]